MKWFRLHRYLLLAMLTTLVALVCAPTVAYAAQQVITDDQGRQYSSFDAALANVPTDGSITLTLKNTSDDSAALPITINRPINVRVLSPKNQTKTSKIESVNMTAGTLSLEAGRFWTMKDKTNELEKTSNLQVDGMAKVTNAKLKASGVSFKNLLRVYDASELKLASCMLEDPERRNVARADQEATICLMGKVTASIDACYVYGDIYVGSGCRLATLNDTDLINTSEKRGTALNVARSATVGEIVGSTVYGSQKALFYASASSTEIERSTIISDSGNPIDGGKDSSDWKGCKVEKSLEGSNRGKGRGTYYGSDREFDNTWFKGVIPEGYNLSRWTERVVVDGGVSTVACRYLVRTDCTLTYDANGGTGDMSSSNKKNQWGDRNQTVDSCAFRKGGTLFASWNTKPDGTGITYRAGDRLSFELQKDVVLYAQWSTVKCTLTFDTQGGTPVARQAVAVGNRFVRPADPTREGYTFGGWYKDVACTQEFDFAIPASELEQTAYARWLPDCTLVFDSMGGSRVDSITVKYGQRVWEPAAPSKSHYRFKGWYKDEQCTHPFDFPANLVQQTTTLYAKWDDFFECHEWDEGEVIKSPTCTQLGVRKYTCKIDPDHTMTEPIAKTAHERTSGFVPYHWTGDYPDHDTYYKAPTCEHSGRGMYAIYCKKCDMILQRAWVNIASLGHDWGGWTPVEGTNEERRVCKRDQSHVEVRTVPSEPCKHGHLEHVSAKDPSCTEQGNSEYWTCPDCHEWFLDKACTKVVSSSDEVLIQATGHTLQTEYETITEVEPTCTTAGVEKRIYRCATCKRAISTSQESIEPLGHDWGPWVPVEGTNEEERVCTRDASHTQRRDAPHAPCSHQHALHVERADPTCTQAGRNEYWACPDCQEWFLDSGCTQQVQSADQVVISALGHKPGEAKHENEVAPTCEQPGSYDEVVRCTVCNEVLSSKEVPVEARGHTAGESVRTNVVEATCEHAGTHDETVSCTVCGKAISHHTVKDSEPLGHVPGETKHVNEVAPTCTDAGSYDEVTYCSRCNKEYERKAVHVAPLDHDWGAWTRDDEGTSEVRICKRDSRHMQTRAVITESCTHENKTFVPAQNPTCTSEGSLAYWACPDCMGWFLDEACTQPITTSVIVPRLDHTPGEEEHQSEVSPSCTQAGSYVAVVKCTECGEELSRKSVIVPATGHTAGESVRTNVVEATCEHVGTHDEVVSCTTCGETLSRKTVEDAPALGHQAGSATREEIRAATCEEEGLCDEVVSCTVCGQELSRKGVYVPPTGHTRGDPVRTNVVEATCEHAGTHDEVVSCTVCDRELSRKTVEDAQPLGHVPGKAMRENVDAPDCEEDGNHDEVVRCERCGEWLSWDWVLDAATGHDWGTWQTVKEATRYDEGLAKRVCAHDKTHVQYRAIPTLEHEHALVHMGAKPATCMAEGHNEYWCCEDCGAWFLDAEGTRPVEDESDVVVPCLPHKAGEAVTGYSEDATCEEDGYHTTDVFCDECGALLHSATTVDEALGHDWGDWKTVEVPTDSKAGLAQRTCRRDSSHVQTKALPAEHTHDMVYMDQVDATCTENGVRAHWCCADENCSALFADEAGTTPVSMDELTLPMQPHVPNEEAKVEREREATCSEKGVSYEVTYCKNCGEEVGRNTVTEGKTAHREGEPVYQNVVPPTCSVRGAQDEVVHCADCDTELWRRMVSIPCTAHTPGEVTIVNVVKPTKTEPGSHDEVISCTVCSQIISWETIEDPPTDALYYVSSGAKGKWTRGDVTPLTVVFKRSQNNEEAFDLFQGLMVDDEQLNSKCYTAERGGVIVKLLPTYLETLGTGEHTLTARFADGSAQTTFTVITEDLPDPEERSFAVAAFSCDQNTHESVADVSIESSSHPYEEGSVVTVSAPTKKGWAFVGWYPVKKTSQGLVEEYDKDTQLSNQRSYTFTVTEDTLVVAVYEATKDVNATVRIESVNGASYTVALDGVADKSVQRGSSHSIPVGTKLTITAKDPERVVMWLNESQKVIGTGQTSLDYTVTSSTTIALVYSTGSNEQTQVKFLSADDQVMLYRRYSADLADASSIELAAPPAKLGNTFVRWVFEGTREEATREAILAKVQSPAQNYAEVTIRPVYKPSEEKAKVTLLTKKPNEDPVESGVTEYQPGTVASLNAPAVTGMVFESWRNAAGEVLGHASPLKLYAVGDQTITACYVPNGSAVQSDPVIAITGFNRLEETDGRHRIQCLVSRNVPSGYTLLEHGVLYGTGLGGLTEDTFVNGHEGVLRFVYKGKTTNGAAYLTNTVSKDDLVVYYRAYMVLTKNGSSDQLTYYSNIRQTSFDAIGA
ncbi:MAG: InlB B-repeat-containing protein [Atopobiaceae bacterium]|nr:InlB B-repeat-containing protein [Atopobiaceae bacterium]